MKKVLGFVVLGLVVFVVVFRERLFLRDPLGTVRRDGVVERGVAVMINYSNDVLLVNGRRVYLVQDGVAGVPVGPLRCVAGMGCLTEADRAAVVTVEARGPRVSMTNRVVRFVDEGGGVVEVGLR